MARLSTVSSFFLSQIGVREFLPDMNINSNILTEESVVNILQSIIVKNVKKLCLSRRTLTKQKQFSETTTATCVDLISKCTTLVDLDLEGCFYLSPSQVSQLLESLPNLTRLLVLPRWNRELDLWGLVNDLPDCVNSTAKLFADDTKLYREIIDPDDCQEIQEDLNTLSAWSKIWLLRFNETKCIVLRIRKCFEFIYYLNGIPLIEEDNQRDLGVIISNNLHPDCHISHIVKKANQRIGLIRRCFTNLTSEKVSILYKSIVRPILEYGSTVWSPYLVKDIEALDKVQRRCTRISNHPFHIEPLELRRRRQDMCEVYKYLHHSYKTNTDNLFKLNTSITRGHNFKLTKHFARTDVRKNFFSNRVVNYWNDLPSAVVSAPTLDSFKRRLKARKLLGYFV